MFSHQKSVKKAFFYLTFPRGSCLAKIRVSCQTFKMVIQRCFYLIPHLWPFKNHWTGQKSCFLIRRLLKKPFSVWPPPRGSCFAKIRVSCQTFKMVIEMFLFNPPFWPFKNHWTGQKSCFPNRRVLKKSFFLCDLPQEVWFCQNKSQLSNLQNGHTEMFFYPPFLTIKNHWTGQKSCFLIRRVLRKPLIHLICHQGVLFCQNKSQLSNL